MPPTDLRLHLDRHPDWVPQACALPSVERPLRQAEFDDLFATLTGVERSAPTVATLTLAGGEGLASRARDLTARESSCCEFFTFDVAVTGPAAAEPEEVRLSIAVPEAHVAVLAALLDRAERRAGR